MCTLYVAPTYFSAIILSSLGSLHQHFFKTYSNKIGHYKHKYVVVLLVYNFTGFG